MRKLLISLCLALLVACVSNVRGQIVMLEEKQSSVIVGVGMVGDDNESGSAVVAGVSFLERIDVGYTYLSVGGSSASAVSVDIFPVRQDVDKKALFFSIGVTRVFQGSSASDGLSVAISRKVRLSPKAFLVPGGGFTIGKDLRAGSKAEGFGTANVAICKRSKHNIFSVTPAYSIGSSGSAVSLSLNYSFIFGKHTKEEIEVEHDTDGSAWE